MLLHLDQAKLTRVLFTLRFAKFTQRFDRIDLSHTVAQQFVSSQACSHHVVFPLRRGRVSRSDHIFFLRTCLHMFRRQTKATPGMFQRVDCLQDVGDVGAQFKFQNHPAHFTTVRLMLRSKQVHNKHVLSSHGFACPMLLSITVPHSGVISNNNESFNMFFQPNVAALS